MTTLFTSEVLQWNRVPAERGALEAHLIPGVCARGLRVVDWTAMDYAERLENVAVLGAAGKMGSGIVLLVAMEMADQALKPANQARRQREFPPVPRSGGAADPPYFHQPGFFILPLPALKYERTVGIMGNATVCHKKNTGEFCAQLFLGIFTVSETVAGGSLKSELVVAFRATSTPVLRIDLKPWNEAVTS